MQIIKEVVFSGPNYKRTTLIMNKYTLRDLILLLAAGAWAIVGLFAILLIFVPSVYNIAFAFAPTIVIYVLVEPVKYYHNNLEYVILTIKFHFKTKIYSRFINKIQ